MLRAVDGWQLVADVLWTGFWLSLIASAVSVLLARHGHRQQALVLLFIAVLWTLVFSFLGGFSIGRFTAAIPVLLIGYMVGMGRGAMVVGRALIVAAAFYIAFSWLLIPLASVGDPLAVVFGAWGIPAYLAAAIAAFTWSLMNPPRGGHAQPRSEAT
jgi:hypothetical protein